MSDPHVTGRYTIIVALVTGILSVIGITVEAYFSNRGSSGSNTKDTVASPSKPDQPSNIVVNNTITLSPTNSNSIEINNPSSKEITKKPTQPSAANDQPNERSPNTTPPELNVRATEVTNSYKKSYNTFNKNFTGNLAITDLEKKDGISLVLQELLAEANHQPSTSFFRSNFYQLYGSNFWEQGADFTEELKMPSSLKCICMVKENVYFKQKNRPGGTFTAAKGSVDLKILNTVNGMTTTIKIPVGGSGADDDRAYQSFQENFSEIFKDKHYLQKFEPCRN